MAPEPDPSADLPGDIRKLLAETVKAHEDVERAYNEYLKAISLRRARVLKLRTRGVTGYSLARYLGVSQTSIGNWINGTPKARRRSHPTVRASRTTKTTE